MVHSSRERAEKPHEQFKIGDLVCTADGYNHGGEDCVVLMTGLSNGNTSFHGVVVWGSEMDGRHPGYMPGFWATEAFRLFHGRIILEQ